MCPFHVSKNLFKMTVYKSTVKIDEEHTLKSKLCACNSETSLSRAMVDL